MSDAARAAGAVERKEAVLHTEQILHSFLYNERNKRFTTGKSNDDYEGGKNERDELELKVQTMQGAELIMQKVEAWSDLDQKKKRGQY